MRPASRLVVAFLVGVAGTWLVSSLADSATPGGSIATASPPITTTATTAPSTGTREHPPGPVEPKPTPAPPRSRTVAIPGIGAPRVASSSSDVRGTTSPSATGIVSSTIPTAVDVTVPEPRPSTTQADDNDADAGDGELGEPPAGAADHDEHDHEQLDDAGLADAFAVALWSWRFDDPDGRLERTVGAYADTSVLAPLVPAPDELQRRRELREVSWAIVVSHAVTGDEHRIELTQHAYNDASAETTTTRHVVVAVTAGRVTAATIVDQPTP